MEAKISLDLSGLDNLSAELTASNGAPEIATMLKQWRHIYLAFVQRRAVRASRGDGTWAPLSPKTIARRRGPAKKKKATGSGARSSAAVKQSVRKKASKPKKTNRARKPTKPRKISILKDTGTLLNVLNPTVEVAPGTVNKTSGMSILVGYGGSGQHVKGRATIAEIAEAHQLGNKKRNLPARPIIVMPDDRTYGQLVRTGQAALNKVVDRTQIQQG